MGFLFCIAAWLFLVLLLVLATSAAVALYVCGWTALASLVLWRGSEPRLPFHHAALAATVLAGVRLGTGLVTLYVVAVADSAWSRLDPRSVVVLGGLPWLEAGGHALLAAGMLGWARTPPRRALAVGVLLEALSAGYARVLPLRALLEDVAMREDRLEDHVLVAWDPVANVGIDASGAAVSFARALPGPFDAVETGCVRRAGTAEWTCGWVTVREPLERIVDLGDLRIGVRPDGTVWSSARGTEPELTDVRDLAADRDTICVLDGSGTSRCRPRGDASPLPAPPPAPAVRIAIGSTVACAIDPAGELACAGDTACWGERPPGPFVDLHAGPAEVCAKRSDGTVACWGGPRRQALPAGARDARPTPEGRGIVDADGHPVRQAFAVRGCE